VTGAQRVQVRRGPGKHFPAFAVVNRGSKVDVQDIDGDWARIVTAAGQRGYVNSAFLTLTGERERAAVPAATTLAAPRTGSPDAAELRAVTDRSKALEAELRTASERGKALEADLRGAGERNKALEAEIHGLQQQVAELKSRPEPASAAAVAGTEHVQTELARLAAAVEGMQRRLDARPAGDAAAPMTTVLGDEPASVVSAGAVLLGMFGVLVGWFLGGAVGRKQERGRRSRIRF
jgi:hypothetical protein